MSEPPERTIGFTDLGMDSLMALEVRRALERGLQQPLPTTIAFEYPTVEKLATYLLDTIQAGDWRLETRAEATSLQSRISNLQSHSLDEPIAVISMACRFPGADTPEQFWQLLSAGVDLVQEVPASRWNADDFYDPVRPTPGKM